MTLVMFAVRGVPIPQGSNRSFERHGKIITKPNNAGTLERWRGDVRQTAIREVKATFVGAVSVGIDFIFERPQSHLLASGGLRKGAPEYPRQDIDKLLRAVLDALTGIAFADDSQVTHLSGVTKSYGARGGAYITIEGGTE